MIRQVHPLENKADFNRLTDLLLKCLDDPDSFRFLSYSLIRFDKETIESLSERHKEQGIEYLVYETNGSFSGVLAYKGNSQLGFELFLLTVIKEYQKNGIGQSLVNECIKIAQSNNYKSIDSLVFADNKIMLRLLIKNDFIPVGIQYHARADGKDLVKLSKYI